MSVPMQIFSGSVLLLVCLSIHISILLGAIKLLRILRARHHDPVPMRRWILVFAIALLAVVGSNTIEVWVLALAILALGALPTIADAIYFALTTYTTLGYGDLVLANGYRIFGAFGSVSGLLAFGLSTAFLVNLFSRVVPSDLD